MPSPFRRIPSALTFPPCASSRRVKHPAGETGAKGEHHAVKQGALSFANSIHLGDELRVLLKMETVKLFKITQHVLVFLVVRPAVMANGLCEDILKQQG